MPYQQQSTLPPHAPREFNQATNQSTSANSRPDTRRDAIPITRGHLPTSGTGHFSVPRQTNQQPAHRAYQTTATEVEHNAEVQPPPEKIEKVCYAGQDLDDNDFYYSEEGDDMVVNFLGIDSICNKCQSSFPSRLALHKHLKLGCSTGLQPAPTPAVLSQLPVENGQIPVVRSSASLQGTGFGFAFRGWSYATTMVALQPAEILNNPDASWSCCLDMGCGVTLVDRTWVLQKFPNVKLSKMSTPLKVKGIGSSRHESDGFALTALFFMEKDTVGRVVFARIDREMHLVDGLKANMLIGNDIIGPEEIAIDIAGQTAFISSCGVWISIDAKQRGQVVCRKVLSASPIVLPLQSEMAVPVNYTSLSDDRDFLFQPVSLPHLTLFTHLVDSSFTAVMVCNETHRHVVFPQKQKMGAFVEILYNNSFQADLTFSAAKQPPSNPPLHNLALESPFLPPTLLRKSAFQTA